MNSFLSGKLFIVNDLAIANADSAFFKALSKSEVKSFEIIDSIKSFDKYGLIAHSGTIKLDAELDDTILDTYVQLVDASVLSLFKTQDSIFYFIDGFRLLF